MNSVWGGAPVRSSPAYVRLDSDREARLDRTAVEQAAPGIQPALAPALQAGVKNQSDLHRTPTTSS